MDFEKENDRILLCYFRCVNSLQMSTKESLKLITRYWSIGTMNYYRDSFNIWCNIGSSLLYTSNIYVYVFIFSNMDYYIFNNLYNSICIFMYYDETESKLNVINGRLKRRIVAAFEEIKMQKITL